MQHTFISYYVYTVLCGELSNNILKQNSTYAHPYAVNDESLKFFKWMV